MAEGRGPTHLLDVCNQKFSEFLFSAEYKYLVWLREIEEEALKRFESNFNAEPELMPKTPSQRKNRKKKRSSSFHYENKELTRKRLSRMRSGIKTACFQMLSQSKERLENFDVEITDSISYCITRCAKEASEVQSDISPEGRVIVTNRGLSAEVKEEGNDGVNRAPCSDGSLVHVAGTAMMLPSEKTEKEDDAFRLRNTPSPKAAFNEKSSNRVEEIPAQGLVNNLVSAGELSQELKENTGTPASSQSGHRHPNRVHKNKKVSLAERYSLSNKRKSMVRKSLSRAMAKKKAAQDSSSVCSQVNSHSSLEVFMDDETSDHGKQSYKCSVDDLPSVQNMQDENNSSHKTTSSHANKIIRPFKNFFQSIQKNQLLKPSGSPVKNSVKHSTPTRPPTKGDFVEKQRQRLESLRKKQEAEQQRKQKVEEEKRRRLEEIKLKREERLRKALQARERVEQMEEEKKKRLGQKLSQQEEKSEKVREEKAAEEKNRKKKSIKKTGEAETRKQKMLQVEEEPKLQEQQEKWKTVGEIRKMLEHNKAKQEKGHCGQKGKERLVKPLDLAIVTEEKENLKKEQGPPTVDHQEKEARHMEAVPAGCKWLNITAQKPAVNSSNEVNSPKVKDTSSRKMNPNDYGMDLNSDDSTDDENEPRKPIPAWAIGLQLTEAVTDQYYNPRNINRLFGVILDPKLEDIFYKSKPRYFKRTSSAVWQSPPATKPALHASNSMIKF